MEINISISDKAGSGAPQVSVSAPAAGARVAEIGTQTTEMRASMPGINAGAAPLGLAAVGTHAPMAFTGDPIEHSAPGESTDQSAGAAPPF